MYKRQRIYRRAHLEESRDRRLHRGLILLSANAIDDLRNLHARAPKAIGLILNIPTILLGHEAGTLNAPGP